MRKEISKSLICITSNIGAWYVTWLGLKSIQYYKSTEKILILAIKQLERMSRRTDMSIFVKTYTFVISLFEIDKVSFTCDNNKRCLYNGRSSRRFRSNPKETSSVTSNHPWLFCRKQKQPPEVFFKNRCS